MNWIPPSLKVTLNLNPLPTNNINVFKVKQQCKHFQSIKLTLVLQKQKKLVVILIVNAAFAEGFHHGFSNYVSKTTGKCCSCMIMFSLIFRSHPMGKV